MTIAPTAEQEWTVSRMIKCTECKHACHDWTNKDNTGLYCGNEYSDYFGYNIALMIGCKEGEKDDNNTGKI